jgi:hypothetical protein
MLKLKEENVEQRNTVDQITEETDDDLGQVKRSHKEQEGATIQWERNSVLVQNVNEVSTVAVNERSEDEKDGHRCNGNNDSVQLTQEPKSTLNNNLASHAHLVIPSPSEDLNNQLHTSKVEMVGNRISQRPKKPPSTKKDDLLWYLINHI